MKRTIDEDGRFPISCEFCHSTSYVEPQELWLSLRGKQFLCYRCGALLVVRWHHTEGYVMHLVEAHKEEKSGY